MLSTGRAPDSSAVGLPPIPNAPLAPSNAPLGPSSINWVQYCAATSLVLAKFAGPPLEEWLLWVGLGAWSLSNLAVLKAAPRKLFRLDNAATFVKRNLIFLAVSVTVAFKVWAANVRLALQNGGEIVMKLPRTLQSMWQCIKAAQSKVNLAEAYNQLAVSLPIMVAAFWASNGLQAILAISALVIILAHQPRMGPVPQLQQATTSPATVKDAAMEQESRAWKADPAAIGAVEVIQKPAVRELGAHEECRASHLHAACSLMLSDITQEWDFDMSVPAVPCIDEPASVVAIRSRIPNYLKTTHDLSTATAQDTAALLTTNITKLEAALPQLLSLLGTAENELKLLAVQGVRDAAHEPSMKLKIAAAGGLVPLIRLLKSDTTGGADGVRVREAAAQALSAISSGQSTTKCMIAELGAIPELLKLANSHTTMKEDSTYYGSQSPCTVTGHDGVAALGVLCNLAGVEDIKTKLVESGAIPVFVKVLNMSKNPVQGREYAAAALAKMADQPVTKAEMLAKNALQALVQALKGSGDLPKYSAGALAKFVAGMKNARNGAEVVKEQAVQPLINLLMSRHQTTQQNALWALTELAYSAALKEEEVLKLVPSLKRVMVDGSAAAIENAAQLLDWVGQGLMRTAAGSAGGAFSSAEKV